MRKCLITILGLWAFACQAVITEVQDMQEVFDQFRNADENTLALFDVDMVLVQPGEPAFQMANIKRFGAAAKRIMKEVPVEKQMIFLSLMTVTSDPVLIDERIPQFLQQLAQNKIPAMAITANLTGQLGEVPNMEKWRIEGLQKLGIDFTKTQPSLASLVFDDLAAYRGNYSTYLKGFLFVNGTVLSKGDALLSFFEKTGSVPDKIVFIDDREENLKSVEHAVQTLAHPVEFVGLHFLGAQHFPSKEISEEEFVSKWQGLAEQAKALN